MYINITDSESGNNKSSSGQLVHYLDKENRIFKDAVVQEWFNGQSGKVPSYDVSRKIDNNIAKLSREDAKFFLINISPSSKEIEFLKAEYGEDGAKEKLKAYAVKVMDEYAKNFYRKCVDGQKDLLWFGKLENHRYYSHRDKEVKDGLVKRGSVKPGEHMHVQVIVSRKDITNSIKLSPMNNSKGRNAQHSKKLGQFDRTAFKASGEKVFDEYFGFDRGLKDSFAYANAQKNGTLEERLKIRSALSNQAQLQREMITSVIIPIAGAMQNVTEKLTGGFLELALGKPTSDQLPSIPKQKKRRRKGGQQLEF